MSGGWVRWTPELVAEIVAESPDGLTINEFAARAELSAGRASKVLVRAYEAGVLDWRGDGRGRGRPLTRYYARGRAPAVGGGR